MKTLQFTNPVFRAGRNVTCRRGVKWASETDAMLAWVGMIRLSPVVIRFADIYDGMIKDEHDPSCRTVKGLLAEMRRIYPDFNPYEIVTLVAFDVPEAYAASKNDL